MKILLNQWTMPDCGSSMGLVMSQMSWKTLGAAVLAAVAAVPAAAVAALVAATAPAATAAAAVAALVAAVPVAAAVPTAAVAALVAAAPVAAAAVPVAALVASAAAFTPAWTMPEENIQPDFAAGGEGEPAFADLVDSLEEPGQPEPQAEEEGPVAADLVREEAADDGAAALHVQELVL